jgi:hypothetical protein
MPGSQRPISQRTRDHHSLDVRRPFVNLADKTPLADLSASMKCPRTTKVVCSTAGASAPSISTTSINDIGRPSASYRDRGVALRTVYPFASHRLNLRCRVACGGLASSAAGRPARNDAPTSDSRSGPDRLNASRAFLGGPKPRKDTRYTSQHIARNAGRRLAFLHSLVVCSLQLLKLVLPLQEDRAFLFRRQLGRLG